MPSRLHASLASTTACTCSSTVWLDTGWLAMRDMRLGVGVGSWTSRLPTLSEERRGAAGAFSLPIILAVAVTEHVDARRGGAAGIATFISGPATAKNHNVGHQR